MERTGKIFFYEDKNFQGQYFECSSDCPELSAHVSRCNSIRVESGTWVVYERSHYTGYQYKMIEVSEDLTNLQDRWRCRDIHSAHVQDGVWVFYEQPNFRGRQYLLEKGEYRRHADWGALQPSVGSIRRVLEF